MMLSGLILGLNQPENDTYLRPLIEDLNIIWYKCVGVFVANQEDDSLIVWMEPSVGI
jgi:hypothetical protein